MQTSKISAVRWWPVAVLATVAAPLLVGCGAQEAKAGSSPTQAAAKVNSEEISVHQINYYLQRMPELTQANVEQAGRDTLERLISQEVAVQEAKRLKLDRNPAVMQAMEMARREALVKAYADHVGEGVAKPTAQEVSEFYAKRPELFRDRKIYSLVEAQFAGDEARVAEVKQRVAQSRNVQELLDWAKGANVPVRVGQATQPAENVPLEVLPKIVGLADGKSVVIEGRGGVRVVYVLQSQRAAVDEAAAKPMIERFLVNERRRQAIESALNTARNGAKVERMGKFAAAAPAAGGGAALPAEAAPTATSGTVSDSQVGKGLGLK